MFSGLDKEIIQWVLFVLQPFQRVITEPHLKAFSDATGQKFQQRLYDSFFLTTFPSVVGEECRLRPLSFSYLTLWSRELFWAMLSFPVNKAWPGKHKRQGERKNLHTVIRLLYHELALFGYVGMRTKVYLCPEFGVPSLGTEINKTAQKGLCAPTLLQPWATQQKGEWHGTTILGGLAFISCKWGLPVGSFPDRCVDKAKSLVHGWMVAFLSTELIFISQLLCSLWQSTQIRIQECIDFEDILPLLRWPC